MFSFTNLLSNQQPGSPAGGGNKLSVQGSDGKLKRAGTSVAATSNNASELESSLGPLETIEEMKSTNQAWLSAHMVNALSIKEEDTFLSGKS